MRKIILIAPGLVAGPTEESVLRQNLTTLARIAESGDLVKLRPLPPTETPESLVLGFPPGQIDLAQGPLTIAALGADPPERSTHFHLSPMALSDGCMGNHQRALPPEQVDQVMARASLLNTKSLKIVVGEGLDHGLVWEGLGDLGTTGPRFAEGKPIQLVLPQGDNEPALRRLIDDSVNLLGELELNKERIDQGLQPINVLWPWGHGTRTRVPNLALKRGEPAQVMSPSLRLAGLTRLAGYRHLDRAQMMKGLGVDWASVGSKCLSSKTLVVWFPIFQELRAMGQLEEMEWLIKQIDDQLLSPMLNDALEISTRLSIICPNETSEGLGCTYEAKVILENSVPFDERALDERLKNAHLHEQVNLLLTQ